MSHDLAVWLGPRPRNDRGAGREFEKRTDAAKDDLTPPGAQVRAFVYDLLKRWPEGASERVWASWPLLSERYGDFLHLNMTFRPSTQGICEDVKELSRKHGLVAYDPQLEEMI